MRRDSSGDSLEIVWRLENRGIFWVAATILDPRRGWPTRAIAIRAPSPRALNGGVSQGRDQPSAAPGRRHTRAVVRPPALPAARTGCGGDRRYLSRISARCGFERYSAAWDRIGRDFETAGASATNSTPSCDLSRQITRQLRERLPPRESSSVNSPGKLKIFGAVMRAPVLDRLCTTQGSVPDTP